MIINKSSNAASERISILIGLLKETELFNNKYHYVTSANTNAENNNAIQELLYNAIEAVAEISGLTTHDIERVLNDVVVNDDMRLNIVHFCKNITDWLVNGDKSALKEVLITNISEDNQNSDLQAIESWYTGE